MLRRARRTFGSSTFVEFGVEDGTRECNTIQLRQRHGWTGLLLDGSHHNATINLHQAFITAENINSLFDQHEVPTDLDLLSVDIDFNDYWVLRSILQRGKHRPRVIVVEVNSHLRAHVAATSRLASHYCGTWLPESSHTDAPA